MLVTGRGVGPEVSRDHPEWPEAPRSTVLSDLRPLGSTILSGLKLLGAFLSGLRLLGIVLSGLRPPGNKS